MRRLSGPEIRKLGSFDATLALSVLHHVHPWEEYLAALLDTAPLLFVEVPHPRETLKGARYGKLRAIHDRVVSMGPTIYRAGGVYDPTLLRPLVMVDRNRGDAPLSPAGDR
jgi:hypothetical protein